MSDSAVEYIGWDLGGAHLKQARVGPDGGVRAVQQVATPLWEGLGSLESVLDRMTADFPRATSWHAVTMTGELVDSFPDRAAGVMALLDIFCCRFGGGNVRVYTVEGKMLPVEPVRAEPLQAASANWRASAAFAALGLRDGMLVDVGSTTTDIIPFRDGALRHQGTSDQERLRLDELVYTGIVRTPVMALVRRAPFKGAWQNVAAELFATMADVYRITRELDESCDLYPPADKGGKSRFDSIRRLARMLGADARPGPAEKQWEEVAAFVAERQLDQLQRAVERVRAREFGRTARPPLAGAGSGRFVVRKVAGLLGHPYVDFADLVVGEAHLRSAAAVCAGAVAVAQLAWLERQPCA